MPHIAIAVLLLLAAQQPPPRPQFKTGVNLVEVDVIVTDRSGRPVKGLGKDDFEVFEDGRPVELASFSAFDLPEAPENASIPAPDRSGSGYGSNEQPEDGRVILVVLDDYHVSFDGGRIAAVRSVVRRLIERLGPSDQVAIIATSGRQSMQAEFTADKARLLAAVNNFFPQAEFAATGVAERGGGGLTPAAAAAGPRFGFINEIKARWAMETMSNAAKALAEIPHRRKAVMLVSQGLSMSLEEIITNPSAGVASQGMRDFIVTAQRSNVAIYTVDPCGLVLDQGCSNESRDNLRSIAEGTGGFAVLNTNAPERGVDRMVAENGTYYLLGYYSPAPPNDGRRHRIKVTARRPGVEIRAREGYVNSRRADKAQPATGADALAAAPIQTRGLTMRLSAVPVPLAGKPGSGLAIGVYLRSEDAVGAGNVDFRIIAVDSEGKVRARQQFKSTFTLNQGAAARWTRFATRMDLAPGRYQIRLAAAAPSGVQGSVFTEATVPKFTDDLTAGGLSLGPAPAAQIARVDRGPGPLPLMPLPLRTIPDSGNVVAQLAIRADRRRIDQLTIVTTLHGPGGPPREIDRVTSASSDYASEEGRVYRVALPDGLEAGPYRVSVTVAGGARQVTRELEFSVE
jgi:VWFA-related protein